MNDLYSLIKQFESDLDKEKIIVELKDSYIKVKNNKTLIENIKKYKENNYLDNKDIINDTNYREVKHNEALLNYLILEINKKLKDITSNSKERR